MDMMISTVIITQYEPYSRMNEFWHGYQDYVQGRLGREPYRGLEAAMRTERKASEAGYLMTGERQVQ